MADESPGTPVLRRGVRLSYDHTRDSHVVLFPEGVLVPNPTAMAVLRLCDGRTDVPGIVAALDRDYAGVREDDVRTLLTRLTDRQVITWT
ncbi:pyrroloquinoline quinone biosynthesis peptide chaperone PqqD [Saccharomonospora saliphila]|uniref:pyrroloquinoline quinone biosynthesis peptide chaperone PqqD n=1 Tax=Saccharomonospora saliphila TaxID=369829 RepID=UPI000368BBD1|nr:pyrroloquinoline quinone biosynthesis peptide chaperone PqqD [Saccharomonospora saliphila]